jgi:pheromone shutdown protein TraB
MRFSFLFVLAAAQLLSFDSAAGLQSVDCSAAISLKLPNLNSLLSQSCISPVGMVVDLANSTEIATNQSEVSSEITVDKEDTRSELNTVEVSTLQEEIVETQTITRLATDIPLIDPEIGSMIEKYKGRFSCCTVPQFPNCDILLCGTLHVAKTSADMVKDAIQVLKPGYIVLELCEARVDNLCDEEVRNVTFADVVRESYKVRSLKVFGMGLLTWMQLKTAKALGSKLGEEQTVAAKVGIQLGSTVILGDRLYGVTFQRVSDKLKLFEKLKFAIVLLWEVLTMSFFKLKDYIRKSENQEGFIQDEIARFAKHLPAFAKVLIEERDEYLAQTIFEIARVVGQNGGGDRGRTRVMAVVGAGHLEGIKNCLAAGGVSEERIIEISSSSKHPYPGTWLGRSMLQVVNPNIFQPQEPQALQAPVPVPVSDSAELSEQLSSVESVPESSSPSVPVPTISVPVTEIPQVVAAAAVAVERVEDDIVVSSGVVENIQIEVGVGVVETDTVKLEQIGVIEDLEVEVEAEVPEVEEHVDAIVKLLESLTPVVERAYAAVSAASIASTAVGAELSPDLKTYLALLGEAVQDAKTAFTLTDAADKRGAPSDEMERELNGLSNAVVRAEVAANAVIQAAEQVLAALKE